MNSNKDSWSFKKIKEQFFKNKAGKSANTNRNINNRKGFNSKGIDRNSSNGLLTGYPSKYHNTN